MVAFGTRITRWRMLASEGLQLAQLPAMHDMQISDMMSSCPEPPRDARSEKIARDRVSYS